MIDTEYNHQYSKEVNIVGTINDRLVDAFLRSIDIERFTGNYSKLMSEFVSNILKMWPTAIR